MSELQHKDIIIDKDVNKSFYNSKLIFDYGDYKISSIYEPQQSSLMLLTSSSEAVNVLTVDTFDERAEDYAQFENTIVVCEQVDKSIAKSVEDYIIKFPKLEEWQLCDYAKTICPNLEDEDISWLVKASDNSIKKTKCVYPLRFATIGLYPKAVARCMQL